MKKEEKEELIENITDLSVWLAFTTTLIASVALTIAGVVSMIEYPTYTDLLYLVGATIAMGLHITIKRL